MTKIEKCPIAWGAGKTFGVIHRDGKTVIVCPRDTVSE
jgi:hypothetical protein